MTTIKGLRDRVEQLEILMGRVPSLESHLRLMGRVAALEAVQHYTDSHGTTMHLKGAGGPEPAAGVDEPQAAQHVAEQQRDSRPAPEQAAPPAQRCAEYDRPWPHIDPDWCYDCPRNEHCPVRMGPTMHGQPAPAQAAPPAQQPRTGEGVRPVSQNKKVNE